NRWPRSSRDENIGFLFARFYWVAHFGPYSRNARGQSLSCLAQLTLYRVLPTGKIFLDLSELPTQIRGRVFAIWTSSWTSHSAVTPPPTGIMFLDLSAPASTSPRNSTRKN